MTDTMMNTINQVAETVAMLCEMGIKPVSNSTDFKAYTGGWGSICNYCKVTVGKITQVKDPAGNDVLAVLVQSVRERESGEDLVDVYSSERRYVALDNLEKYLNKLGFRR